MSASSFQYRPAVDGLRACAVLAVVLFHLDPRLLPGGFSGVDVFFVISGYLITSILKKGIEAGTFSLAEFYQRRIARISPAFFCVAFATVVAALLVYSPQDAASSGANLAAASLSVANLKYMLQGNYFDISADAQPFLHYWSLAVEEQFYLIYPVVFVLLVRWMRVRMRVLVVLGLVFACSFCACVWFTAARPVWAFYLLPTRAWELLGGCVLAVGAGGWRGGWWASGIQAGGLVAVLGSFIFLEEGVDFPGWQALLPVAGAAGLLLPVSAGAPVERLLSLGPLRWVGKISYSLYLWHWPVFSVIDYGWYGTAVLPRAAMKVLIAVVAAVLSYRWIEEPSRRWLNHPKQRKFAFGSFAVLVAIAVVLGVGVRRWGYVNATEGDVAKGGLVYDVQRNVGTVMLMGDSNASMYGFALRDLSRELGRRFVCIGVAAGDPLPAASTGGDESLWASSLEIVRREQPDCLVLVCHWSNKLANDPSRLRRALAALEPHVHRIVLLTQPPSLPPMANRESIREGVREPFFEESGSVAARAGADRVIAGAVSAKVSVLEVAPLLTNADGAIRFTDSQHRLTYHDGSHLTAYGAALVVPALREALR